jgi:hypothetical protein
MHEARKHTTRDQMENPVVMRHDLYPVAPCDAPEHQPDQLQLLTNNVHQLAAQVETLSRATAPTKQTYSTHPTTDFDRAAGGRYEHDARQVTVTTALWSISILESGHTTLNERSLSSCPPSA